MVLIMKIDTVVLAGGMGTRLRSVVSDVPKPMAPVNGTPFIFILLKSISAYTAGDFVISAGYMADELEKLFADPPEGLRAKVVSEKKPLGTGGAIKFAAEQTSSENILAVNGDSFLDIDYSTLFRFHTENDADLTMALVWQEDASRYGAVETDRTGRILSFSEKGTASKGFINAGAYIIKREVLKDFSSDTPLSFEKDVLPDLLKERKCMGFKAEGSFTDIGTPEDYRKFCRNYQTGKNNG